MSAENQKTIGGRLYSFGALPPTEALRVEVAVARVIGEPMFKMLVTAKDPIEEQAVLASAVGLLLSKMDPDDLIATMTRVLKFSSIEGTRFASIDADFANRNKDLWLVFIAALKFNFMDFFPAALLASIDAKVATLSPSSPPTSTGTSGAQ